MARRDGTKPWDAYTPYELRSVGTMVRLGQRDRAHQLLDWFFTHQRPAGWYQWAEVVWQDPTTPKFIGDMPHTWVGTDYVRSVLDMFAYERESDSSLVLGAGVLESWVAERPGVTVRKLSTHYGPVSYTMRREPGSARVSIQTGTRIPPGGIVVHSPFTQTPRQALVEWSCRHGTVDRDCRGAIATGRSGVPTMMRRAEQSTNATSVAPRVRITSA